MIRIKIAELLGKHKMTQSTLAQLANIRPATVSNMYYEEVKRIDVRHLDKICKIFECSITDVIEYIPDES